MFRWIIMPLRWMAPPDELFTTKTLIVTLSTLALLVFIGCGGGGGSSSSQVEPDTDNDGIPDSLDSCPSEGASPWGLSVDGCPLPEPPPEFTFYKDLDGDLYSDGVTTVSTEPPPYGFYLPDDLIAIEGDCDDGDIDINPVAEEFCDDLDNNCDDVVDELCLVMEDMIYSNENPDVGERFGLSVSAYENTFMFGSPGANGGGEARIYEYSDSFGWEWQKTLSHPDPRLSDSFGKTVLAGDQFVAVGTPDDNYSGRDCGSVHVSFKDEYGEWGAPVQINPDEPLVENAFFGTSMASTGNELFVGSPGTIFGLVLGDHAVYSFVLTSTGGTQTQKIIPRDHTDSRPSHNSFGASVSSNGKLLAIGEPHDTFSFEDNWGDPMGERNGSVHIYKFNVLSQTWEFLRKLKAPRRYTDPWVAGHENQNEQYFGSSVLLTDDYLFIGSPGYDSGSGIDAGSVAVWKIVGDEASPAFVRERIFKGAAGVKLGVSMAYDEVNNRLVATSQTSKVYSYYQKTDGVWVEGPTTTVDGMETWESNITAGKGRIFVGSPRNDDLGPVNGGAVYVLH